MLLLAPFGRSAAIKQINAILFLFSFKKIASRIDKHVMSSYLLLFKKRLEFDFFKTPSKIPTCTSQGKSLKICDICILPQRKTLPQITVVN